ncbi:hypothetical protein GGS23DRAFT_511082 [Durotheca rogersii]|uniref:uncharacterized protein n=1 Tax=Durotheca rogersii TaxID=419775 RepID=UPI00221F6FF9|nr:uncharacterized protein GGS23DRAFT_511082 [Durotheca rogersii]KAI5863708.1 hypothetical protein GGS23DRAFT_511082 [Durotheca rogersii]
MGELSMVQALEATSASLENNSRVAFNLPTLEYLGTSAFELTNGRADTATQYFSPSRRRVAGYWGCRRLLRSQQAWTHGYSRPKHAAFIVPSLSYVVDGTASITVAARNDRSSSDLTNLPISVAAPVAQPVTLAAKIVRVGVDLVEEQGPVGRDEVLVQPDLLPLGRLLGP